MNTELCNGDIPSVTLFDRATGVEFSVTLSEASGEARRLLRRAEVHRQNARVNLRQQHPELLAFSVLPKERQVWTDALIVENAEFDSAYGDINDNHERMVFRALVNRSTLTAEQVTLIASDVDGEFWLAQDMEQIETAVARFHASRRVAGPSDRVDAGGVDGQLAVDVADVRATAGEAGEPAAGDGVGSHPG